MQLRAPHRDVRPIIWVLVTVIALFASGCWPWHDDVPLSEMELKRQSGSVSVVRGSERIQVEDRLALQTGDLIETEDDSVARLRLEGTRLLEMLETSRARVIAVDTVEVLGGEILADATQSVTLQFEGVYVEGTEALFRIDRGIATTRAGVYRGNVLIRSPGEVSLDLPSFYEVSVTANVIPSAPRPYRIDRADAWDVRHLEPIVKLEENLDRLATGLANQAGNRTPGVKYFKALADRDNVDFMKPYLDEPVEDLIVGFTVATGSRWDLPTAVVRAFDLHGKGGSWGIVAAIMEVPGPALLANLEAVIGGTGAVASGRGGRPDFTVAAAQAAGNERGSDGVGDPGSGGSGPGSGGGGNPGGPDESRPTESPKCASDDVVCQVGGVASTPSPLPTPTAPNP